MTTAHRPSWTSAVAGGTGGKNASGGLFVCQTSKISNRDAANYTVMKDRKVGQGAPIERESKKDYRLELEKKEKKHFDEKNGVTPAVEKESKPAAPRAMPSLEDNPFPEDADDAGAAPDSDKDSEEEEDDEEDTEELMRELEKIKKEREEDQERVKEQQRKQDQRSHRDEVFKGNPLLQAGDFSLKRKWDDDTVFKNQARTAPKVKERYINDAVRSDFHKRFLNKYVWTDGHAH